MDIIGSQIDTNSADFQENFDFHTNLKTELQSRISKAKFGGER